MKNLAQAVAIVEDMADVVPELSPAVAAVRRIHGLSKHEAARLARLLAESLRGRGRLDDARTLLALAIEIEPGLKDVLHARAVPADERSDEPWAEKTPEVPTSLSIDDEPTDMDR